MHSLLQKIGNRTARIAVIGLGYVGLPLAIEFCMAGFRVVGIDTDQCRIASLKRGCSYVADVSDARVRRLIKSSQLRVTDSCDEAPECDCVIICVPTPLGKSKVPDIRLVLNAVQHVSKILKDIGLVTLESTTFPGTTDDIVKPMLEQLGCTVGAKVFLAFAPERLDPGNRVFNFRNTPKLVGGVTRRCSRVACALYSCICDTVVEVSTPRVAETAKLLENTFRTVNIALANELALMCERMGIDVWEVINAAKTKPFGFLPFYPGPGVGGHCLPIDPIYLAWKGRIEGFFSRFIDLAVDINSSMPRHVVARTIEALNMQGKCVQGSTLLILGVSYKKDIGDIRESPALEIMKLLIDLGANVDYHDQHVRDVLLPTGRLKSVALTKENLAAYDCAIICTDHSDVDYEEVCTYSKLILDTRNIVKDRRPNVARLGAPLDVPALHTPLAHERTGDRA